MLLEHTSVISQLMECTSRFRTRSARRCDTLVGVCCSTWNAIQASAHRTCWHNFAEPAEQVPDGCTCMRVAQPSGTHTRREVALEHSGTMAA